MKKLIFIILFGIIGLSLSAQIAPPRQTDTLFITSVKYNYADIHRENWPCDVIYKSTTSFRIGKNEFQIIDVSKCGYDINFIVTDNDRTKRYHLTYNEYKDISITFSGYEFTCSTKPPVFKMDAVIKVQLDGRTINGSLPKPHVSDQLVGKVVVDIWVDSYGIVQKAVPGAAGTSVTDVSLWNEAHKAAMKTSFNMSIEAPSMQKGSITYIFDREEFPIEKVEEAIPFQLVEEKPSFRGGDGQQFSKWVHSNLVYPKYAKENGVQGRVTLQFTVEKDGSVTKVRVLRGVDAELDEEAVRVVSMSPKWKPGKQSDRAVPVTYTFPVIFQLP